MEVEVDRERRQRQEVGSRRAVEPQGWESGATGMGEWNPRDGRVVSVIVAPSPQLPPRVPTSQSRWIIEP